MATQKAVILQGNGKAGVVTDRPIPKLRPGYVLVNVKAVALNPTDWKHRESPVLNNPGCLSGCDYAGVVAEVGPGCTKQWKKGDRICGFTHGGNNLQREDGAFAQKIVAKADIQIKIPDHMSFEEAATLGVAIVTVGQGLYEAMGLNFPNTPSKDGEFILIYGGSSAMGTMGLQFAKLSGYKPIATCSPQNFELVKSMGAIEVWDYHDPDCVEKIKRFTDSKLNLIWDTICSDSAAKLCAEVLAYGGKYGKFLSGKFLREDAKVTTTIAYMATGEPLAKGPYQQEDTSAEFEFMKKWIAIVDPLLAAGKIKPHPQKVGHGFDGILDGMDLMRDGKLSGGKLVFNVEEK